LRQAQTVVFECFEQNAQNEGSKPTKQLKKQKQTLTDQSNKQNSSLNKTYTKLKKQTRKTNQ
jgi:hypothetical protein